MALNVLVVDDSQVMRKMIIKTLRMGGIPIAEIHEASNGRTALEMIEQHKIGLALLDINMPILNGITVLERLRSNDRTRELPVLVISTEGSEPRQAIVRRHRASFIRKPFTPESLVEAVVQAIGV